LVNRGPKQKKRKKKKKKKTKKIKKKHPTRKNPHKEKEKEKPEKKKPKKNQTKKKNILTVPSEGGAKEQRLLSFLSEIQERKVQPLFRKKLQRAWPKPVRPFRTFKKRTNPEGNGASLSDQPNDRRKRKKAFPTRAETSEEKARPLGAFGRTKAQSERQKEKKKKAN